MDKALFKLPKTRDEFVARYILKEDLVKICAENNLPRTGSKEELIGYICDFIEGRTVRQKRHAARKCTATVLSPDMTIDENYSNNETHRAFFRQEIGVHFKFNVPFLKWMESHKGKSTYADAIAEWKSIYARKKSGEKFEIDRECKYNRYTRDFFAKNKHLTREDCIRCWNYKKGVPGNQAYEDSDLEILK